VPITLGEREDGKDMLDGAIVAVFCGDAALIIVVFLVVGDFVGDAVGTTACDFLTKALLLAAGCLLAAGKCTFVSGGGVTEWLLSTDAEEIAAGSEIGDDAGGDASGVIIGAAETDPAVSSATGGLVIAASTALTGCEEKETAMTLGSGFSVGVTLLLVLASRSGERDDG
jgi:hypothetical protein